MYFAHILHAFTLIYLCTLALHSLFHKTASVYTSTINFSYVRQSLIVYMEGGPLSQLCLTTATLVMGLRYS